MADTQPPAPASSPLVQHRPLWLIALALVLVIVLIGGLWALTRSPASGRASVPQTSLTPTPTTTPRVVYTADWSHSADGWTLPPSVHIKNGQLVFTGSGEVNLAIPYQPPVTGYTVAVGIEIDGVNPVSRGGTVTIAGQDANGTPQYFAQLLCAGRNPGCFGGQLTVSTKDGRYPNSEQVADFHTGPYERTYTIQVDGPHLQLCLGDGECFPVAFVNVPTTPLQLVLQDNYLVITVTSVAITIP